jgi:hypothetical protein
MCTSGSTINTSRTNHSIFSDDFPAARPTNKETRCITRGTTTRGATTGQRVVVVVVRRGLLPAGNDETDGLLRPLQPKERGSVPQEGRGQALSRPRILDEVPPLSVQDKTHFYAGGQRVVRVTLLPANTRAS